MPIKQKKRKLTLEDKIDIIHQKKIEILNSKEQKIEQSLRELELAERLLVWLPLFGILISLIFLLIIFL